MTLFFFLIVFWELEVQRSGNESILLLWCPAKWISRISSQCSIERGGLSISSMIYRALSMCMVVPALPHTHRTQPEPLSWGWAAFLTSGLNAQGKQSGQWELEIKIQNKSSFFETFYPLSFIWITCWTCSCLYVSFLSPKTADDTISPPPQISLYINSYK